MIDCSESVSELWMGLGGTSALEGNEAGSEDPCFETRIEPRELPAIGGHQVAMGPGGSMDQAFAGMPAQVVAGLGRRVGGFARAQEAGHVAA
ncbi:MAG TPA: hypothetical protein VF653_04770, partial [Methylomirabilota bacterium]